ncbi:MAG TPA: hypothetical protein VJT31_39155 [Rugosimonospora sp.]|nr:hypothetical protein [Rugosimonospora sp.]
MADNGNFTVDRPGLTAEAAAWDVQGAQTAAIAGELGGARINATLNPLVAGVAEPLFRSYSSSHDALSDRFAQRCGNGQAAMARIAKALRDVVALAQRLDGQLQQNLDRLNKTPQHR